MSQLVCVGLGEGTGNDGILLGTEGRGRGGGRLGGDATEPPLDVGNLVGVEGGEGSLVGVEGVDGYEK